MATTNETARSGKTQTLNEVLMQMGYLQPKAEHATQDDYLVAILTCIQRMPMPNFTLMVEHWDWLVVLQCLQDHGMFKSNPTRPPFAAFEHWLKTHEVAQPIAHCSVRNLTYVNKKIAGARYPWTNVKWEPNVLKRWRILYLKLDQMLAELQTMDFSDHN